MDLITTFHENIQVNLAFNNVHIAEYELLVTIPRKQGRTTSLEK